MKSISRVLLVLFFISGAFAVSPSFHVQAQLSFNAEINKSFSPISIVAGETSRLSVTIYNPNSFQLNNAAWSDSLVSIQPGIVIGNPVNPTNTCGGTVNAVAGGTTLSLSGGTVSAKSGSTPGACTVAIDVTSTTPGNLINTIPAGGLTATSSGGNITNTTPASATLNVGVVSPPSLNKNFNPNTVWVGQTSQLTINIINNDLNNPLTQATLNDTLPTNVVLASPVSPTLTNCGSSASLTAVSGNGSLTLNNASISPNTTCRIQVNVVSSVASAYTNTIPIGAIHTRQGVTNASIASGSLNVQSVSIAKAFLPSTIQAGETSTLTITLRNPTTTPYTGVILQDALPGTVLTAVDGTGATTCGSGTVTITLPRSVKLENGTIPAGTLATPGFCTITFNVTTPMGASSASYTNTIDVGGLITNQGATNVLAASTNITIQALSVGILKSFSPLRFQAGGTSTLTITLQNRTSHPFHVLNLTDTLLNGLMVVTPETAGTTCAGGAASSTTDPNAVTLSGGVIPAGTVAVPGTCTLTVRVTTLPDAVTTTYTNTISASTISTEEGVTNLTSASGSVDVYTSGTGVTGTKSFTPATISAGGNTLLRIDINAPADQALTNVSLTDILPAGITVSNSTAPAISGCGNTPPRILTATTGSNSISLTHGTITAGSRCRIDVYVTSSSAGVFTNTIYPGDISNDQSQTLAGNIISTLTVTNLSVTKSFYPDRVSPNGLSTLTIYLQNTNTSPLTSVNLTDSLTTMGGTLTNGVIIAPTPNASTTCGSGLVNAIAGTQTIIMTGGTIPSQVGSVPGICTISVNVQGKGSATTRINTIPVVNVTGTIQDADITINPVSPATASLIITNLTVGVVKGFEPLTVFGGSTSILSVQLVNPNNAVLSGIRLTDNLPAGMVIANPPDLSTGTCGGTLAASAGSGSFTFSGGTLNPSRRCELTLSVTMNVNGNLTNTIPAGGLTTFNGASNTQPTQATLTNLPGASVSKFFSPNLLLAESGNFSILTITIQNTGNVALTGMGLIDTLPGTLPTGLQIAGSPAPEPVNHCGGTLTADTGSQIIQLLDGNLAGSESCTIEVAVTSTIPGHYQNIIPENTLFTNEDATNILPAIDTLILTSAPEMQVTKNVTSTSPYDLGSMVTYNIVAYNRGDITLTGVTISDPGLGVSLGSCTPAQPATLAAGETMTCTATHEVTQEDMDAASYGNTAIGDSDQTEPVSDSVTIPIIPRTALNVKKLALSPAPHELGNTLNYSITVKNIGADPLSGVIVTDPGAGVTLGTCTPSQPAILASGEIMVCNASHVVTQADVDSGIYTNTAIADSNETGPDTDMVTVPISQSPAMGVFKQVTSNAPYDLGETITYDISVLNTGNQTLTGVNITDPGTGVTLGGCIPAAPATLGLGQMMTCSAGYVVRQVDIDAGSYSNTAIGDSNQTEPGSDTVVVPFNQIPNIELQKTGTLIPGSNGRADAGDLISYVFIVTNTGNVTLTNITLSDPGITLFGDTIPFLEPGASNNSTFTGTYTLSQANVNGGSFTNTATTTATAPGGMNVSDSDDDIRTLTAAPVIDLQKTGTLNPGINGRADVGDTITYAFIITNSGNVTLTNITLSDPTITLSGGPISSLAPGASDGSTFTGTYTLTQANVNAGSFTNTAAVSATPPTGPNVSDTDDDTRALSPAPGIDLQKTGALNIGSNSRVDNGDTISYTFTVTNTGNVTLTNISLNDPAFTIQGGPISSLAPGMSDSTTFTGTYTLNQANIDAGTFTNTAGVVGSPPSGPNITDVDDDTQILGAVPGIQLQKTGTLDLGLNALPDPGDEILYSFTITNTGNVTLTNVTITDTLGGVTISGGPLTSLAPGISNTTTFTGVYLLTQTDIDASPFTNTATVNGNPPSGPVINDIDDDTQILTPNPVIQLEKTGTLHLGSNGVPDAGDTISYQFTLTNTGNVTLNDIRLADTVGGVTISGGSLASLSPGENDTTNFTGIYTITQSDVDAGAFTNSATASATPPAGADVTDLDTDTQVLSSHPIIGISKRIVGTPLEVSTGTWDVTFEILVRNYGNVTLSHIQVADALSAAFPNPTTFTVQSLISADFEVNASGYNGSSDINLLDGTDVLSVGEDGKLTLVVRVIPASAGPFENIALATGYPPIGAPVTDNSQDGANPDPAPTDGDPNNNNDPTPVGFGANLFDPPTGIKVVDVSGLPVFHWTMTWINNTNIVPVHAAVTDGIPEGTTFLDNHVPSGYPLPTGTLPAGSVTSGVTCEDNSTITTTEYCYYEAPTPGYPRGRVVWVGSLGADLGISDPATALNEIQISFDVNVTEGTSHVENIATIDSDLNGDGDLDDSGESQAFSAAESWTRPAHLPNTGFAMGEVTDLPEQPFGLSYAQYGDLVLEIPQLGVNAPIVGIPQNDGAWDISWLGTNVGYLAGSTFPTWVGNSVITGHVWDADNNPGVFANLKNLHYGDHFAIRAYGQLFIYEVRESALISPANIRIAMKHYDDYSWVTLITCEEFDSVLGTYSYRRMVRGVLVSIN